MHRKKGLESCIETFHFLNINISAKLSFVETISLLGDAFIWGPVLLAITV